MKLTVNKPAEIEPKIIRVALPVRYDEEDIPNDFPLRTGDMWNATIDIDTGQIKGWYGGEKEFRMKVVDEGCYSLLDKNGVELASIEQGYVPSCIPEEYGDYVDFVISSTGIIDRWQEFCTAEKIKESFFQEE